VAIFARLRVPGVMGEVEINKLQSRMDAFCLLFVERFGWNNITNYLHNMMGGHFRCFLRKFGNLFEQSNIGLEVSIHIDYLHIYYLHNYITPLYKTSAPPPHPPTPPPFSG
jgi:hypothetical protein